MDKHSEVEAKFLADKISQDQFEEWASVIRWVGLNVLNGRDKDPVSKTYHHEVFKRLLGTDTFYKMGNGVLRHRSNWTKYAPNVNWSTLTVKKRKTDESLEDRKEVDLNIATEHDAKDVTAFMNLMNAEKMFTIAKDYSIYKLKSVDENQIICLAWYEVAREDGTDKHNFIEIEVEKDSKCSTHIGKMVLADWKEYINKGLKLNGPMNASLFEMYSLPKDDPKSIVNMTKVTNE